MSAELPSSSICFEGGAFFDAPYIFQASKNCAIPCQTIAAQPIIVIGNLEYKWASWSDGGAISHQVAVSGPATYTATYSVWVIMTIDTQPSGLPLSINTGGFTYTSPAAFVWPSGSSHPVTLSSPVIWKDAKFVFNKWTDGNGNNPRSIVANPSGPYSYVANFTAFINVTITTNPVVLPGSLSVNGGGYVNSPTYLVNWRNNSGITVRARSPVNVGFTSYLFSSWSGPGTSGPTNPETLNPRDMLMKPSYVVYVANYNLQAPCFSTTTYAAPAGIGMPPGVIGPDEATAPCLAPLPAANQAQDLGIWLRNLGGVLLIAVVPVAALVSVGLALRAKRI
jgi:hypothetical protein